MTTKVCSKCGVELPLTAFSKNRTRKDGLATYCKTCKKAVNARSYQGHKEAYKEYAKAYSVEYYAEHKEERKVYHVKHYEDHKGEYVARAAEYARTPEGKAAHKAVRHNRRKKGADNLTADVVQQVVANSHGICPYCGKRIKRGHLDHIVPVSKGGDSSPDNLAWVCATCNLRKGSRSLTEFKEVLNG